MLSIPTTLFKSLFQHGGHGYITNLECCKKFLTKIYVKKIDDINRLNRTRSHTDSGHVTGALISQPHVPNG